MAKMKIRRGDKVVVTTGKDKGKGGEVLKVMPKENRIVVAGVNVVKRHTRQSRDSDGGIISKELSIHVSNVALADPATGKPSKVGVKTLEDGKKVRFAKKSGEIIVNAEGK